MQENKFIETIDNLKVFGQLDAIRTLRDNLRAAYEYADSIVGSSKVVKNLESKEVEEHSSNILVDSSLYSKYNSKWNNIQKYKFVLKTENRFLHFREAARILIALEGKGNEKEWSSVLSNATRNLKQDGELVKIQHAKALTSCFWGSPKWLDKNGVPLKEHQYDASFLDEKKTSSVGQEELFDI